jgi:CheY-like chemotaxis protein/signal transduction histidine kinase/HAMP domain-containing protein
MKQQTFKTIRGKLTFWFLVLALTPLSIALIVTYFQRVSVIESQSYDKLTAIRDLKVQQLNNWLNERMGDLQVVSNDLELRKLEQVFEGRSTSLTDQKTLELSTKVLERMLTSYNDYEEVFFIDARTGIIEISSNPKNIGLNKLHDSYFTTPFQTGIEYIKNIYHSETTDKPCMTFSAPVYSLTKKGNIIGVVVLRIDLNNSLYKLLSNRVGLGETGETLIVNKDMMALNQLWRFENAPLNLKINATPSVRAAQGETGIVKSVDYSNTPVLAAYTHISKTDWGFVAKQDLYELNAPVREMVGNFLIIFLCSTLIIIILALIISNSITKPIVAMFQVAKKIGEGDFSARNSIKSKDEVGSLALEYNNMANKIESTLKVQQGVVSISETMIGKSTMKDFGTSLLKLFMKITEANMSTFYLLNEGTMEYEHFTSIGANKEMLSSFSAENAQGEIGYALSSKSIYHLKNIPEDTSFKFKTIAGMAHPKEIITIPILVENAVVAIISLVSIQSFSPECASILKQSWLSINTSYSNLISGERTRILADYLSDTNQRLEAQAEELQEQSEELQNQTEELQRTSDDLQAQNIELEVQRIQVEAANKMKSEFLSNMSHELRTPLNSIMALSRVLIMQANNKLNDEEKNYLEIVERNGKRLLSLINDILDLSKVEAGKMDINPSSISIKQTLQMVKENIQSLAEEKNISLNLTIDDNLPLIESDESRLHQVLTNIIGNAVKFTNSGSVDITTQQRSTNIEIEVKDTGIGISKEMLPHIFEEFRQVDGSTSRSYEGTGLGLAIASKIIKVLGGTITVTSELGIGSCFVITVPIKWHEKIQHEEKFALDVKLNHPLGETILVVDDDLNTVNNISEALNQAGYRTIGATSGKEALRLAEQYRPFAITLDIVMQEMDGWEVLQKLKSNQATKQIPVIVVSVTDEKSTGFALGAVGFIQKPIDKNELIAAIKEINKSTHTVMIVDDNEQEIKQMSKIIEAEQMKPIWARNGKECLEIIEKHKPDVLILDLMMPDMDGFEVLEHLRNKNETFDLPVIIATAKDLTREEKNKLRGNVSSLLYKSEINHPKLIEELKKILGTIEKPQQNKKQGTTILLVEDNPDAIVQVRSLLEKEGYHVKVASGGQEALDFVKHTIPDGIVLDLMMPDVDGFEVLERIRSTENTRIIPVLILTAKDLTRQDLSRLSANNIQQLIQKGDIDIDGLLSKVKLMLGNKSELSSAKKEKKDQIKSSDLIPLIQNQQIQKSKQLKLTENSTVLIIEDNPDNMITLKAILHGKFNTIEATNGEDGLTMAQTMLPDLILLDMSLPKMNGEEVVKMLKSNKETSHIFVIAVTAQNMKGDKERFLQAGCNGFVAKPIDQLLLFEEIGKLGSS